MKMNQPKTYQIGELVSEQMLNQRYKIVAKSDRLTAYDIGEGRRMWTRLVFPTKENPNLPIGSTEIMFGFVRNENDISMLPSCIYQKGAMLEERL